MAARGGCAHSAKSLQGLEQSEAHHYPRRERTRPDSLFGFLAMPPSTHEGRAATSDMSSAAYERAVSSAFSWESGEVIPSVESSLVVDSHASLGAS